MMRFFLPVAALILPLILIGCSATPQPMDYDALPGSDHMAKGPGLLSGDQKSTYDGGYTVYSTDKPKIGKATSTPSDASSDTQTREHQDYKVFEAWQRFKQLPKTAPEYQQFQQWLKWQRFKEWQKKQ